MSDAKCDNPKCREELLAEIQKRVPWEELEKTNAKVDEKLPKSFLKWVWVAFIGIGIPLIGIAIGVWSVQQSNILRYADKSSVIQNERRIDRLETSTTLFADYAKENFGEIKDQLTELIKLVRGDHGRQNKSD